MPSEAEKDIRVAVVGAGAFGRNHARVYHELSSTDRVALTAIVDANAGRAREFAAQFGAVPFSSAEDLLAAKARGRTTSVQNVLRIDSPEF